VSRIGVRTTDGEMLFTVISPWMIIFEVEKERRQHIPQRK
jgi:hypothetical protein